MARYWDRRNLTRWRRSGTGRGWVFDDMRLSGPAEALLTPTGDGKKKLLAEVAYLKIVANIGSDGSDSPSDRY